MKERFVLILAKKINEIARGQDSYYFAQKNNTNLGHGQIWVNLGEFVSNLGDFVSNLSICAEARFVLFFSSGACVLKCFAKESLKPKIRIIFLERRVRFETFCKISFKT